MKLKELLSTYKMSNLIDICRILNFRGYSGLKQQSLIDLVYENIKVKSSIEKWVDSLPDSAINLLAIITYLGKKSNIDDVRSTFRHYFPNARFSNALAKLLSMGLVYYIEDDENDIIVIPEEFYPWFQESIAENKIALEEDIDEELSREIKTVYKNFDAFLYSSWVSIDTLRFLLKEEDISSDGSKNKLIARLLYEVKIKPAVILDKIFMKDSLREIAKELELTIGGTREDLIDRIVNSLPLKFSYKEYSQMSKEAIEESEEQEVVIEKPPTLLKFLMSEDVDSSKIREILEKKGVDSSGPRKVIVKRLLEESGISLPEVFGDLFNLDDLKDISGRYGLKKGGKKDELIQRIIETLPVGNLNISFMSTPPKKAKGGASIETDKKQVEIKQKPTKSVLKAKTIFQQIELDLDNVFKANDFKVTKSFNTYIRQQVTRSGYEPKDEDYQEFTTIGDKDVLIFCAVIPKTKSSEISKAIVNFAVKQVQYKEKMAFIWDPKGKLLSDQIDAFKIYTNNLFWYKTSNDYGEEL